MSNSKEVYASRKDIVLNALIERKGLQHLTNVSAEALGNPLFIYDVSGKILAQSQIDGHQEVWRELFPDGYLDSKNRRVTENAGIIKRIMEDDLPVIGQFKFSRFRFLGCRIRDNDSVVAIATVVEMNTFQIDDSELLVTICKTVLFELLYRERRAMRKVPYFGLFKDIIEQSVSENEIRERYRVLNLDLPKQMRLLEIVFPGHVSNSLSLNLLRESLMASIPSCYSVIYSESLLLIVAEGLVSQALIKNIQDVFYNYEIRIGISSKFSDILLVRDAYQELQAIQSISLKLKLSQTVIFYEDILMSHFMEMASKDYDFNKFCLPAIIQIEAYDREHNTLLKQCLEEYLEAGRNIQKAADQLHAHKNTLYYRLKRIEEIFDLDLNDENLCFNLQLSLRMQQFAQK